MKADTIITLNLQALNKQKNRYKYFNQYIIQDKRIHNFITCIYNWLLTVKPFQYKQKDYNTFILTNRKAIEITNVKGLITVNHYINYLCFYGLLERQRQEYKHELIKANKDFIERNGNGKLDKLSVYKVVPLTPSKLKEVDTRLKLYGHLVTRSNISNKLIITLGLKELEPNIYANNTCRTLKRDNTLYNALQKVLDQQIQGKGYCTKAELQELKATRKEVERCLRLYKHELQERYSYKRTNATQRQKLGITLTCYIYTYNK